MSVTLDTESIDFFKPSETNGVDLSQRQDKSTIQKTRNIEIPVLGESNQSLEGRVTTSEDTMAQQFEEILSENLEVAAGEAVPNYVTRMQNLIAKILVLLHQMSELDKTKIHRLEQEYKSTTLSVADSQKRLGWTGFIPATLSLGAAGLQFLTPYKSDKKILDLFIQQISPKCGDLFSSGINAKLSLDSGTSQMLLNQYSQQSTSGNSKTSELQQQILTMLDKAFANLAAATRSS